MTYSDLPIILPELLLVVFALAALLYATYTGKDRTAPMLFVVTSVIMILLGIWTLFTMNYKAEAFNGLYIVDGFSQFGKALMLVSTGIVLYLSMPSFQRNAMLKFEYPILIILATVGMMVMVSAHNLLTVYLGIELMSLSLYVMAAFRRDNLQSTEAGLKYFVLGGLSSGMLLYGISLVYGFVGSTAFADIASVAHTNYGLGLLFGLAFLCVGLGFKISAAPFHMWTPDVYEGAPTGVTTLFATSAKIAAAFLFMRVMFGAFPDAAQGWKPIIALLSAASMLIGSVAAIGQMNFKRLMAYSAITNMGFALMGLAGGNEAGANAMVFFMTIYLIMSLGVFAFILNMQRHDRPVFDIRYLNGYSNIEPTKAAALAILLFSLAGIPPLLGFFGKLSVLQAAIEGDLIWLAIVGVVASVIAAYYYLRIVYYMYFGEEGETLEGRMPFLHLCVLLGSAAIMALAWLPFLRLLGISDIAAQAASSLFG